jgi:DNA-directed RNA polymerase
MGARTGSVRSSGIVTVSQNFNIEVSTVQNKIKENVERAGLNANSFTVGIECGQARDV